MNRQAWLASGASISRIANKPFTQKPLKAGATNGVVPGDDNRRLGRRPGS